MNMSHYIVQPATNTTMRKQAEKLKKSEKASKRSDLGAKSLKQTPFFLKFVRSYSEIRKIRLSDSDFLLHVFFFLIPQSLRFQYRQMWKKWKQKTQKISKTFLKFFKNFSKFFDKPTQEPLSGSSPNSSDFGHFIF